MLSKRVTVPTFVPTLATVAAATLAATAGCAGGDGERRDDDPVYAKAAAASAAPAASGRPFKPGETPVGVGNEKDDQVELDFTQGYLNQNDVNQVLEQHHGTLIACYDRAGYAKHYAAGEVKLRFLVNRTGEVADVLVVDNALGNYAVERCLVVEGRKIPFPKPGGDRGADFEYSIEFRSTQQHHVVDWNNQVLRRNLSARMPSLGRCGPPGTQPVAAVAYINARGSVLSVGLSSPGPIDTMAARCVVEQIRKWRLRGDGGHLVRTSFPVSGGGWGAAAGGGAGGGDGSVRAAPLGPTARLRRPARRKLR
jgi:hypothetical protein